MKVRIVSDSTADMSAQVRQKVTVVPLTVRFGDEEYADGVTITHKEFYEKLVTGDVLPTTSQPTPDAFYQVFRQAEEADEQVVVITISSGLSGTYQSACIAASDFPGRVFVVDSRTVALASGVLVEHAVELMEAGLSAQEIAERLEVDRDRVHLVALLDTLEYLKKGGRISATAAIAGGILSIKPVICIQDGVIKTLGKARGTKQGFSLLNKEIQAFGGVDTDRPLLLGYTGTDGEQLGKYIEESTDVWGGKVNPDRITVVGSTVGTHAGPGVAAVGFFHK
jgi:DegV family protein with EDD domain